MQFYCHLHLTKCLFFLSHLQLVTLNALKTQVDMAAVMSSDLQAHVNMMISQVSLDDVRTCLSLTENE